MDYFALAAALLLFRYIHWLVLGYAMPPLLFHSEQDIYGEGLECFLRSWDRNFGSRWLPPLVLTALTLPFWSWPTTTLYPYIIGCGATITWRAATLDIDLASGKRMIAERLALIASCIGFCFFPGCAILLLFIAVNRLRAWNHHQHITVRSLVMFLTTSVVAPFVESSEFLLWFLTLLIIASHYAAAGVAKVWLGPHWYSWIWDNRLDNYIATAYLWGWRRYVAPERIAAYALKLQRWNRPLQAGVVTFELLAFALLFSQSLCFLFFACAILFHVAIFALSGVFFWQLIVVYPLLLWGVTTLDITHLFTPWNGILFASIIAALPLRGKVWAPQWLAWWDSPFTARIHWIAQGTSGRRYAVTNTFMCPNERIFGHNYGDCLIKEKRVNKHHGELKSYPLYQALLNADATTLSALKQQRGHSVYSAKHEAIHLDYLRRFFSNANSGAAKRVCPWWLKAPGELFFYWNRQPTYHGQEPITSLSIFYREELFSQGHFVLIHEELLHIIKL